MHFYVFNPARKLRLLSNLFYRGSKRILVRVDAASVLSTQPCSKPSVLSKITCQNPRPSESKLVRDADYYPETDGGFCVFQVENTLFKIHRVFLSREPSAFNDMFCLPQPDNDAGGSEGSPVFLSDTVHQFRDLLWALYAPPTELFIETRIDRLLNVAELTNKYCFSSSENWVIERIYSLAQEPTGPLRSASPSVCARILNVAFLCSHQKLQDLVTQHLISRILWYNTRPETIIPIAEKHGLRTLLGVCYYRQLIRMERISPTSGGKPRNSVQTWFPQNIEPETQRRFLAAHQSLLDLWEQIRASPPPCHSEGCPSHEECDLVWRSMWFEAGEADEARRCGSADVLGRMKSVMLSLRKSLSDVPFMTMQCKMSALEAITHIRDEVIQGLITHFMQAS